MELLGTGSIFLSTAPFFFLINKAFQVFLWGRQNSEPTLYLRMKALI